MVSGSELKHGADPYCRFPVAGGAPPGPFWGGGGGGGGIHVTAAWAADQAAVVAASRVDDADGQLALVCAHNLALALAITLALALYPNPSHSHNPSPNPSPSPSPSPTPNQVCVSPNSTGASAAALEVSLNGQDFTADRAHYAFVDPPAPDSLSPSCGPTAGGTAVNVSGTS